MKGVDIIEEDTGGFDDTVLVGLGGVAVARAVCETLNHFRSLTRRPAKDGRKEATTRGLWFQYRDPT